MRTAIILLAICILAASCNNNQPTTENTNNITFSEQELSIINSEDSVLYVLVVGNKEDSLILRNSSRDFTDEELNSEYVQRLAEKMITTVQDPSQDGVGIAAPQVGLNIRMIAVMRFDKENHPFEAYANPYILRYEGNVVEGPEGCLSVPGYRGVVPRRDTVVMQYFDVQKKENVIDTVAGFSAIIFQHETDHLDGILYTDRAVEVTEKSREQEKK
ncbi:MAG: peptide deformylase [Bacteroidales bacterium]|nr:peptide deformylase [Bacteroidales bacterium]